VQDPDYRQIQRCARPAAVGGRVGAPRALAVAQRREPLGEAGRKLDVVRDAARLSYPTADMEQMLAAIERGYRTSGS
jgi:hypothetical protein